MGEKTVGEAAGAQARTASVLMVDQTQTIDAEWGQLRWFANHELGNSSDVTVGRCVLKPGRENPRHLHPNCAEVLVVMKGRIRHTLDAGRDVEMGVGDTISIPANMAHRALNIGDGDAELMIVFSSARREVQGE